MPQISATHLARHLSEILDGVEHRGESFTVERHGRVVAKLEGARRPSLREWADAIERRGPMPHADEFARNVAAAREALATEIRDPWAD